MKPKVLVIATSRKTRGGITSVLREYERTPMWHQFHCHWVQTHRDGPNWRKLLYLAWAWVDFLLRIPFYKIVHVHFSLRTTARRKKPFVQIAKFFGKKVILHLHCGSQIDEIWNEDYDDLYAQADVSLFLSENLRKRVERHTGEGHDYRVCYNPCPVIAVNPEYKKKKYILFSGTLYKGKGYHDLIKAFGIIAKRYQNWNLVLAGNGEVEEGRRIASEYGVERQTIFLGWVAGTTKDKVFKEASFLCLPSYAEGFPMAVLDAWAYGLPVVTTPVGGIPDIARDGENLLLFNPGDIDKLADCLEKLISNRKLREELSKQSLILSKTAFNIDNISKQVSELYTELL